MLHDTFVFSIPNYLLNRRPFSKVRRDKREKYLGEVPRLGELEVAARSNILPIVFNVNPLHRVLLHRRLVLPLEKTGDLGENPPNETRHGKQERHHGLQTDKRLLQREESLPQNEEDLPDHSHITAPPRVAPSAPDEPNDGGQSHENERGEAADLACVAALEAHEEEGGEEGDGAGGGVGCERGEVGWRNG